MSNEKGVGNKKTIPIATMMAIGLALGMTGLIKMDGDTIFWSNFWMGGAIVGFALFVLGFILLNVIQPSNK